MTTVLVVDDEPLVREILGRYLEREGYDVVLAEDGEAALASFAGAAPDLVLLDLMLPKLDGFEVFEHIRSEAETPVIMLTAKSEEHDRIAGLERGADDYVTKPFSPGEVVARVRAVLRRSQDWVPAGIDTLELGRLRIDPRGRRVHRDGAEIALTPREFDLLLFLATQPGVVFGRTELLEELWDFAFHGDPATVTVHVRRLREKIEDDPSAPRHLVTVWGTGYRFDP
ncbi:MAG TPA: response regulator transcription factor [Actinomycetota bacterium]|nr:response regulator transcription factor [Actinomycetota bacterium]